MYIFQSYHYKQLLPSLVALLIGKRAKQTRHYQGVQIRAGAIYVYMYVLYRHMCAIIELHAMHT